MICPSCTGAMSEESHGGVRLDLCNVCFGVWFDGGELESYHAGDGSSRLRGLPGSKARYEPTGDSAHVRCPRCERDILRTGVIARYQVMRCTSCRGLFLPLPNPHFKTAEKGIVESTIGVLEEIVGALF
jgi:Zn-finger nucleic acid-binding protein